MLILNTKKNQKTSSEKKLHLIPNITHCWIHSMVLQHCMYHIYCLSCVNFAASILKLVMSILTRQLLLYISKAIISHRTCIGPHMPHSWTSGYRDWRIGSMEQNRNKKRYWRVLTHKRETRGDKQATERDRMLPWSCTCAHTQTVSSETRLSSSLEDRVRRHGRKESQRLSSRVSTELRYLPRHLAFKMKASRSTNKTIAVCAGFLDSAVARERKSGAFAGSRRERVTRSDGEFRSSRIRTVFSTERPFFAVQTARDGVEVENVLIRKTEHSEERSNYGKKKKKCLHFCSC